MTIGNWSKEYTLEKLHDTYLKSWLMTWETDGVTFGRWVNDKAHAEWLLVRYYYESGMMDGDLAFIEQASKNQRG